MFDIVTVYHNETNYQQHLVLWDRLRQYAEAPFNFIPWSNMIENIGFSSACNIGAKQGNNPFIGFLNPDCWVEGPIFQTIASIFSDPRIKVTGANFNKNPVEIEGWGLSDWVCGAAMFVRRDWWEQLGGFDEQFVWAYEETDFHRRTEQAGGVIKSLSPLELPILHSSPADQSAEDAAYKDHWMAEGGRRFWAKWQ